MAQPAYDIFAGAEAESAAAETTQIIVRQAPQLTVIEGGLSGAAEATAGAGAAEVAGGVAAGEIAAGEVGAGVVIGEGLGIGLLGATGIGLVAIGLGALGYFAYQHLKSDATPAPKPEQKPETVTECPDGIIKLKCKDGWDDCQKKQARAKVQKLNDMLKNSADGFKTRSTAGDTRDLGNQWAAKFRDDFNRLANGEAPSATVFTREGSAPTLGPESFMDDCLYQQWLKSGKGDSTEPPLNAASPDHIQELQLGGHVQGPMAWLDRSVNQSLGSQISSAINKGDLDTVKGFKLDCK